jgi:hypothetical protein
MDAARDRVRVTDKPSIIVSVFPFRNRVSSKEAFEGLELGEGKPSRPVLRGPGGRKAAWLLGSNPKLSVADYPEVGASQAEQGRDK